MMMVMMLASDGNREINLSFYSIYLLCKTIQLTYDDKIRMFCLYFVHNAILLCGVVHIFLLAISDRWGGMCGLFDSAIECVAISTPATDDAACTSERRTSTVVSIAFLFSFFFYVGCNFTCMRFFHF